MQSTVIAVFTDDRIDGVLFERAFERYDHQIEGYVFNSPEKGIDFVRSKNVDVIFIEVHFWGENFGGISILQQIRNATSNKIVAIAVTSLLQKGDLQKIQEAGFAMCIEKPLSADVVKNFLNRKQLQSVTF